MKCYVCEEPILTQNVCYDHAKLCEEQGCDQPCSPLYHYCEDHYWSKLKSLVVTSFCVLSYLSAIVIANWSVSRYGQKALPITALIIIPFDLMSRDVLHERWRGKGLWVKMFILIIAGSLLSYYSSLATARVSLASAVSFLWTGFVDTAMYHLLDRRSKIIKMNVSNLCSAATDSLLFPMIAFGSINLGLSAAQTVCKVVGAAIWVSIYLVITKRKETVYDCGCADDYS